MVSVVEAVDEGLLDDEALPFSPELPPRPSSPDINLPLRLCLSTPPLLLPPDSADRPDPIEEAED